MEACIRRHRDTIKCVYMFDLAIIDHEHIKDVELVSDTAMCMSTG